MGGVPTICDSASIRSFDRETALAQSGTRTNRYARQSGPMLMQQVCSSCSTKMTTGQRGGPPIYQNGHRRPGS